MFEEEQGLNEDPNDENPELERIEENIDQQESEEIIKDDEGDQEQEKYEEEDFDQQESGELDQDEKGQELEKYEEEDIDQQESGELDQDEEGQELEKYEEEDIDQQESEEIIQDNARDQKETPNDSEEMVQEIEKDQENIEQEILADLEEMDKEIESLPSQSEELDQDVKGDQEEIPSDSEEMDNNIPGEEISQESIEEFIEQDQSESSENEISGDELSADELVSEEIDELSRRKNIIEGALFVAGRPISLEELNIKTEIKKKDLEASLEELMLDYLMRATSLEIVQIQDKFSLQIKPEYTPNVKKFATGGLIPDRHLKTLTIIALKQPILKSKLVKIRGSGAYEHVKFLLDRGFINAIKKGRSYELMTTENFADTFGLSRDVSTLKKQMINQLGIDPSNNSPNDSSDNEEAE
ncbi:MAG: SMC-Scp complex subunit ScpB [Promethearchaeota archaeon]